MNKYIVFTLWILFFVLTLYIGNYYRPYIYKNNIYDYGLADVGYNPIAVVNMSLISWLGFYNFTQSKIYDILINTAVYLSLEILSFLTPISGVFDIKDCYALIFGCFLSFSLFYLLDKKSFLIEIETIFQILKNKINLLFKVRQEF